MEGSEAFNVYVVYVRISHEQLHASEFVLFLQVHVENVVAFVILLVYFLGS